MDRFAFSLNRARRKIERKYEASPPFGDLSAALVNACSPRNRGFATCKLQANPPVHDARVIGCTDRKIDAGLRIPEKQRVRHQPRIESLAAQLLFLLLEGFGGLQCRADPDENRVG